MERAARLAAHFQSPQGQAPRELEAQPTAARVGGGYNVAVLGAAGGIGQPLSLLLKLCPRVAQLRLYDVANTAGVAADLSHINTAARITAHTGADQLPDALYGAHLVVIPAGVPRKPGMTRDDLFNINAGIVRTLCEGVARYCPTAWVALISNPVNSTVPIAAEVFRRAGTLNPGRLFGVTTLDVVRANTFVAQAAGLDPGEVNVPVIGGHAGVTILPVLSAATPRIVLPEGQARALMERIQDAGTEVVKAKAGAGSATLSMAQAAARFAEACMRAMGGEPGVVECAYVASSLTDLPYFASQLRLGPAGIEEFLPLPRLNALEQENFERMKAELQASIQKGLEFVRK